MSAKWPLYSDIYLYNHCILICEHLLLYIFSNRNLQVSINRSICNFKRINFTIKMGYNMEPAIYLLSQPDDLDPPCDLWMKLTRDLCWIDDIVFQIHSIILLMVFIPTWSLWSIWTRKFHFKTSRLCIILWTNLLWYVFINKK